MNDFHAGGAESMASVSDPDLMAKIGHQDRQAFREIYDRYIAFVLAICLRICGQNADAQAVTTTVFIEIWKYPNRYRPNRGQFRTYIGLLARSRARDYLRHESLQRRHHREWLQVLGSAMDGHQQGLDPAKQIADVELRKLVRQKLETLPTESITVLTMSFYDGLSHSEIAESLGLPLGTVKSRLRRGLQLLGGSFRDCNAGTDLTKLIR